MVYFDPIDLIATFAVFYGIYAILAISLNLEYGYAGQPNFGQVLFYGLGAFVAAIVGANLLPYFAGYAIGDICNVSTVYQLRLTIGSSDPGVAIPVWMISLVIAMAIGGLFGLLLSYPAIRVKEEWYLSMILLIAGEAFVTVFQNTNQLACGIFGLDGFQNPFSFVLNSYSRSSFASTELGIDLPTVIYALIILGFVGACYFVAQRLANSPYGRLLKSIRDDKVAAESLGKDVAKVRRQIMIIGSIMAGLAGGLYVYYIGVAVTDDYVPAVTFTIWVMMILGGYANNKGVLAGALFLTLLERGAVEISIAVENNFPGFNPNVLIYAEYAVEAVILILLLIYRPKGILPETRVKTNAYTLFDFNKKASPELDKNQSKSSDNAPKS
jgi:branched-chain amino acid transport system permease protein